MKLFQKKKLSGLGGCKNLALERSSEPIIPNRDFELTENDCMERTRKEINESELFLMKENDLSYNRDFNAECEILNLKMFNFTSVNNEFEVTPKNSSKNELNSENVTPNSMLVCLETSVGSGRNSFISETPQTDESLTCSSYKHEKVEHFYNLKTSIDKLEELYMEVQTYIKRNYPYYAYSKYLELSMFLFSVLSENKIDENLYLEMSLLLSTNTALESTNLHNINIKNEICSNVSVNNKYANNLFHRNTKNLQGRCSPIALTPSFHNSLKGLKFYPNKVATGSTSGATVLNNSHDVGKQLVHLELVYLNRNGIPMKNSHINIGGSGNGTATIGSGGITKRLRNKLASVVDPSNSASVGNYNVKKGKLFVECFPLLVTNEGGSKTVPRKTESKMTEIHSNQNAKVFFLEEFPCIIFSNSCFPVYNSRFSSVKNRNYSLDYIRFPTQVKCVLELTGVRKKYENTHEFKRLKNFIVRLVTDINIHHLRFSLYKCSSSYMDLVSALRIKKKNTGNEEERERSVKSLTTQRDNLCNRAPKSEWNSFGDSNMGMWWAMRSESEFLILCDCIVNTCPINVLSIVNESDLHLHWAPFVNNSECLSYIGLFTQIVRHSSNMPWPIGMCQSSLYCVAIDAYTRNDLSKDPFIIITAVSIPEKSDSVCGIKVKDTQVNVSKLDILSLCFVIQPVPNSPMQTRISFLSKSVIPIPNFVPKAVPSFIARQIGKSFYNNIIGIIEKFNDSPFYYRINSDLEFYGFIAKRLNIEHIHCGQETNSKTETETLDNENKFFCLNNSKAEVDLESHSVSPSIRRQSTDDLKQKNEMLEGFSGFEDFIKEREQNFRNNTSKYANISNKPSTNRFSHNVNDILSSMFPSL